LGSQEQKPGWHSIQKMKKLEKMEKMVQASIVGFVTMTFPPQRIEDHPPTG
jgi:hypothetical protein